MAQSLAKRQAIEERDQVNEKPRLVFSLEKWSLIFGLLNDHLSLDTLAVCHKTCKVWKDVLDDKVTTFLFPQVLPHIMNHLDNADVLACRLTCRGWRSGVDNLYPLANEDSIYTFDLVDPRKEVKWKSDFQSFYTFDKATLVQKFMKTMASCPNNVNPFITKKIRIKDVGINESHKMWELVHEDLLPRFGHHIKSCDLIFTTVREAIYLNVRLHQSLEFIPNLKVLKICFNDMDEQNTPSRLVRPFPRLDHLTSLNIVGHGILPAALIVQLMADNLERLHIATYNDLPAVEIVRSNPNPVFPKLTSLNQLISVTLPNAWEYNIDGEGLLISGPLRVLQLQGVYTLKKVIELTSVYSSSLQSLKVGIEKSETGANDDRLVLPNLKNLQVSVFDNNIDFLLPLTSLMVVEITVIGKPRKRRGQTHCAINFSRRCQKKMHESVIWSLMKNLKILRIIHPTLGGNLNSWCYEYKRSLPPNLKLRPRVPQFSLLG